MNSKLLSLLIVIFCLLCSNHQGYAQNILNTSYWTAGSSSWGVTYFNNYGSQTENVRESGKNHVGEDVLIWKSKSDGDNGANGGWNSYNINLAYPFYNRTVRFSVWIKKTNSNTGTTYFGFNAYGTGYYDCLPLDGNFNDNSHPSNPYFFAGDLPKLNHWYLLVGYVHEYGYTGANLGRIYDGVTGEAVQELRDYTFYNTVNQIRHRAYLANDTNSNDVQYLYAPRMEYVNGNEWTINQLLSINPDSKLLFAYDNSGNQKQRFYCAASGCAVPTPPAGRAATEDVIVSKELEILEDAVSISEEKLSLYPNPTKGLVLLKFSSNSDTSLSNVVNVYNNLGILVKTIPSGSKNELEIDLTSLSTGMYLVHIHLSNGKSITKQIIKQ